MSEKSTSYKYAVDLTPSVLLLIFLAKIYRFDLEILLLLYDKIGEDIFYVFFLLAGRNISMPKHTRLLKLIQFSQQACDSLERGEKVHFATAQEEEAANYMETLYDPVTKRVIVRSEIQTTIVEEQNN